MMQGLESPTVTRIFYSNIMDLISYLSRLTACPAYLLTHCSHFQQWLLQFRQKQMIFSCRLMANDHCHHQSTLCVQMQSRLLFELHAKQILEEILGISDSNLFVAFDKIRCVILICIFFDQCVHDVYLEQVITQQDAYWQRAGQTAAVCFVILFL